MLDILTWFFLPEDLNIVKGSPQIRRRFIDMELGQISAVYLNDLAHRRILKQKNNYLKQLQLGQKQDTTMLEVLNQQFAICFKCNVETHFIKELESLAKPIHAGITNERETLSLTYLPSIKLSDMSKDEQTLLDEVITLLNDNIKREMDRGVV